MEQINIFDLLEAQHPVLLNEGLGFIDLDDVFVLEKGTKVYIDPHYSLMYEVINDDGHSATLKYVQGYKGTHKDEIQIPSLEIVAIAKPDFIPLPIIKRPRSLEIEQYKGLDKRFISQLSNQEKLDMITYIAVLSAFNTSPDKFLRLMKEGDKESAFNQIWFGSSYIRPLGSKKTMNVMYSNNDKTFHVHYFNNFSKAEIYHSEELMKNYERIHEKIKNVDVSTLNPFELMILYREKGYVLRYRIETDEWFIQHPYSTQDMGIPKGRDSLNDVASVIQKYENKMIKKNYSSFIVNAELDLFGNDNSEEESELDGFTLPKGSIVSIKGEWRKFYKVLSDDGKKAFIESDETGEKKEVNSENITFIYPYEENRNICVPLPRFNRPATLTVETLIDRRENYHATLSDKEVKDLAIARITSGSYETTQDRFQRAMQEGNEKVAKSVISGKTGGSYSDSLRLAYSGQRYSYECGVNKVRKLDLTVNEVVSHYKQMVQRIHTLPAKQLSLGELIIAYRLKNYQLSYDHITDEYRLKHRFGYQSIQILKGRERLNQIDETIEQCERLILKK